MNIGKAIYSILKDDTVIDTLVADRVYPISAPQRYSFPLIVYSVISVVPYDTKSGPSTVDEVRIQIDSFSKTYSNMVGIDSAIRSAMDRYSHTMVGDMQLDGIRYLNSQESKDSELNYFHRVSDFQVRVKRSFWNYITDDTDTTIMDEDGNLLGIVI